MQSIFVTDIAMTVMFMYDIGSGLLHIHFFSSCRLYLQAQFVTRTASFVNLRSYQKAGGLQDGQHEGEAEEDSLLKHTHIHRPVLVCECVCVYFPHGKG